MQSDSGKTISPWLAGVEMPDFPRLTESEETEVCVVGAGISGLTTAYLLALEGKQVLVLEDGTVGGGETGRTTAHISNALDDRYFELERIHGEEGARLAAQSHTAAIEKIEETVRREGIECDFLRLDGYLFEPPGGDPDNLQKEFEAARRAGIGVELVPQAPAPFETGLALRFPGQAQFHPLRYLRGLSLAIQRLGGRIHTGAHVTEIEGGTPARVQTTSGATVHAGSVVVATNTPVNDRLRIHSKQAAYRTYAIGVEVPREMIRPILLWDDDDPYHYVRLERSEQSGEGSDILIVGGEDHKTGQQEDVPEPFSQLEAWTRERYPMAGAVKFCWSGQVMEPVDKLGFIGRNPLDCKNVYVITGDSGNGMTHGTIGGLLVTDLIQGRRSEWEQLYDPSRKSFSLPAVTEYARENINVAGQYSDYLKRGDIKSEEELQPGQGGVVRRGPRLIAVFRDEAGIFHERSAVCPHLGCVVRWNPVEKTWDCPCHGSRYDCNGGVLNGPATSGLAEL